MSDRNQTAAGDRFPTETTGLPVARRPEVVELLDRAAIDLEIAPVAKQIGDATVRMLAYNASIPGPTLKVAQGSEIDVTVINHAACGADRPERARPRA
jgi:FtsP/CotA-like multicopper oxidase with cupredoxin domain